MAHAPHPPARIALAALLLLAAGLACARTTRPADLAATRPAQFVQAADGPTLTPFLPPTHDPNRAQITPTPNHPRALPTPRLEPMQYVVQTGDSLGPIAQRFGVSAGELIEANQLLNPNLLHPGQVLEIPPPRPQRPGSPFKIIPDSELVRGPMSALVDYETLLRRNTSYLLQYREEVDEVRTGGLRILERVAQEYSVNPLLLLTVLEYRSGWVTQAQPAPETRETPIHPGWYPGLYRQLAWAANQLNLGYYLWRVNGVGTWVLADGSVVPIDPTINAGTAGVQNLFAGLYGRDAWDRAVSVNGLFATYSSLFGYPFDLAVDPLVPDNLAQPDLQLPFEVGRAWSFTGGPHGGWDSGSAWAALDFAPPGRPRGCVLSNDWVVAMADGLVVRSENGAVVQDLDGDGLEQTGWTLLYMHIESRDRVAAGTYLQAGQRIGHPSCEGGVSTGTHVHIARRYNGEWIPADQSIPFVLDGWRSLSSGILYNGILSKNGQTVEACECRSEINTIQR